MKEKETHDNDLHLPANWDELKNKIIDTYPTVNDEDLQFMAKGKHELIGRLQQKTGHTQQEIRRWVKSMGKVF